MISETFGQFVNKLTFDGKYSLCNSENLPQPIQMKLFKKQNTLSEFPAPFLKSALSFELFEAKDNPQKMILEITDCKRRA